MRSKLSAVEGVESVDVDYKNKTAKVKCSDDCDPKALLAALEGSRFSATVEK